ncbi:MAG TPA: TolC family protein [Chthoniobacterales bacterium]|nr:TolC family protein [Chthoniobacterales bacterium]
MRILLLFSFLFFNGCMGYQTYHSVPLSSLGREGKPRARSLNALEVDVAQLHHPLLPPITLSSKRGIGPDQAAVLSVLLSPKLVAERDRRGLAQAQLVQAGVLPNPSIGVTREFVTGGFTTGAFDPYGFNASWDVSSLVSHGAKVKAARTNVDAVSLDVAWTEWQTAEGAKLAFYRVVALETQLIRAKQIDADQQATVTALQAAVDRHEKNVVDLAAAQATRQDSLTAVLALQQELDQRRLALKRAIGFLPQARLAIRYNFALPSSVSPPSEKELIANLENQRLDLVGLRAGYQSQEETVRAAILAQFPKVALGFTHASDNSNVHTTGFGITFDLPLFDRNQGAIATEKATRLKLYDEYANRVFEARSDIASALTDIRSLNQQITVAQAALPVFERLVDTAKTAAEEGAADVLGYFQARISLNQRSLQILKLKQTLIEAKSALELASGRYLPAEN